MLVGAGGNAGNQAAVLVIRGLATGEVTARSQAAYLCERLAQSRPAARPARKNATWQSDAIGVRRLPSPARTPDAGSEARTALGIATIMVCAGFLRVLAFQYPPLYAAAIATSLFLIVISSVVRPRAARCRGPRTHPRTHPGRPCPRTKTTWRRLSGVARAAQVVGASLPIVLQRAHLLWPAGALRAASPHSPLAKISPAPSSPPPLRPRPAQAHAPSLPTPRHPPPRVRTSTPSAVASPSRLSYRVWHRPCPRGRDDTGHHGPGRGANHVPRVLCSAAVRC